MSEKYPTSHQVHITNINFDCQKTYNHTTQMKRVLIIDSDIEMCQIFSKYLQKHEYSVDAVHHGITGVENASKQDYDVILSDYKLPDIDGLNLLKKIKKTSPGTPVIIITNYQNVKSVVSAIKMGASDYLSKPVLPEDLLNSIQTALVKKSKIETEKTEPIEEEYLITDSDESNYLYKQIELVSSTNYSVILYGES